MKCLECRRCSELWYRRFEVAGALRQHSIGYAPLMPEFAFRRLGQRGHPHCISQRDRGCEGFQLFPSAAALVRDVVLYDGLE